MEGVDIVQVVFDPENLHRRKSSLVLSENPPIPLRSPTQRNKSQCLVHKLVEKTSRGDQSIAERGLEQIDEQVGITADGASSPEAPRATHSRLLTKKQLSEMATSVRSLAKRLGSVKIKLKIKTVFLLTKAHDQTLIAKTREVARWLLSEERGVPYIVYVENTMEDNKIFDANGLIAENHSFGPRLKYWTYDLAIKK